MIKKVSLEELLSEQQITLPVDISDTEDLEIALTELDDNLQIIQDTVDETETMSEIGNLVDTNDDKNNEVALETLRILQQDLAKRSGITLKNISIESYAVAKEGIQETFKHLTEVIMKALQNAICWIKDFFSRFFDKVKKYIRLATEIIDSAKSRVITPFIAKIDLDKQLVAEEGYIKTGPFTKYLRKDNSPIGGHQLTHLMISFLEETEQLLYNSFNEKTLDNVNAVVGKINHFNQHDQYEEAGNALQELLDELPMFPKSSRQPSVPNGNLTLGELKFSMTDSSICSLSKKTQKDDDDLRLHHEVYIADSVNAKEISDSAKHTVIPSLNEIIKLTEKIKHHLERYVETDTLIKKFNTLSKTISNIKTDKWSDGIKVYHPLKSINDLIKICINTFIKTGSAVRTHDLNTCSAALQFAVISLKVAK